MPTFIFLKNKEKKYILEGANEEKLHELVSMFNESTSSNNQEIDESSEEITHLNSSTIDDDII